MRFLALACLLLGLAAPGPPALADEMAVIELRHRPASELIPVLGPLLPQQAALTGRGFQLVVRAPKADIARIRKLVSQLDSAPRDLLVTVFQGSERDLQRSDASLQLGYRKDGVSAGLGTATGEQALAGGADGASADLSLAHTRRRSGDHPVQRLRVREGATGYIETGRSIPFFSGGIWQQGGSTWVQPGIDYKDTATGFYVRPLVRGDRVVVDISPYREALAPGDGGVIDTRRVSSRVTGRLGEWMELGGSRTQRRAQSRSYGAVTSTRERGETRFWIRVDPATRATEKAR